MRDIGNCSMMGAIWWRAQNASIWSTTIGLPLGEPDTDLCCDISPKTATATGTGTTGSWAYANQGDNLTSATSNGSPTRIRQSAITLGPSANLRAASQPASSGGRLTRAPASTIGPSTSSSAA